MRTVEQFNSIRISALSFIKMHKKHVWIIPCKDEYRLSVIPPNSSDLPAGTSSILVGLPIQGDEYTIHDTIVASSF